MRRYQCKVVRDLPFSDTELEALLIQMGGDGYKLHMLIRNGQAGVFYHEVEESGDHRVSVPVVVHGPTSSEALAAALPPKVEVEDVPLPVVQPPATPIPATPPPQPQKLSTQQLKQQFKGRR